ncbi:MAG: ABC transporter substrate-binding protein [Candidatus Zixiibacteriota bacterium]
MKSFKAKISLLVYLTIILFSLAADVLAEPINLSIVYSDSLKATLRTIRGITSSIGGKYPDAVFTEYLLTSDAGQIEAQIKAVRNSNPAMVLTVGSFATKIVSDRIKDKPIIFSAVLNPETSEFVKSLQHPGGNITGASLDIPPDIQFNYFKKVIKNLKKIGVLYTEETQNLIPPARILARNAGLELHAVLITSEKDIPVALDSLNQIVDGYWSVADGQIYSPRSTRFILLNTLRNAKPFMGFSGNMVESGALFGLEYDYKDIGRQAGKIACEVLEGQKPADIPVAVPTIIWFHYNEKTARHIAVQIPDDLAAVAKEVYR